MKLWNFLKGKKTFLVAGATIVYAVVVVGWQAGDWGHAQELMLQALGLAGIRHGMK